MGRLRTANSVLRLPPSAFRELPANVVNELKRIRCTIPQEAEARKPSNVIRGEFAKPGQTDWAVLCSVNGASAILVFWNGSEKNASAIARAEDGIFLQELGGGRFGYSRAIRPVGKQFIMGDHCAFGGPAPPSIDHQGIDDYFVGKASQTWYFHNGKWLKLAGAD